MAKINGEQTGAADGKSVGAYVDEKGYRRNLIAVEYNKEILPKAKYDETVINANDVLEIVTFVGGG